MSAADPDALAHVRRLLIGTNSEALHVCARLLDAVEQGRDLLAPFADGKTKAAAAIAAVHQLLADAAAEAAPPPAHL